MAKHDQIPKAVDTKIYKTGQTRGADDDVIFQNRVSRNSTVLIPYKDYMLCKTAPSNKGKYENGFIVLIKPEEYFDKKTRIYSSFFCSTNKFPNTSNLGFAKSSFWQASNNFCLKSAKYPLN